MTFIKLTLYNDKKEIWVNYSLIESFGVYENGRTILFSSSNRLQTPNCHVNETPEEIIDLIAEAKYKFAQLKQDYLKCK